MVREISNKLYAREHRGHHQLQLVDLWATSAFFPFPHGKKPMGPYVIIVIKMLSNTCSTIHLREIANAAGSTVTKRKHQHLILGAQLKVHVLF